MTLSAALCRGLIEALWTPRLMFLASTLSAALCRGLIEAAPPALSQWMVW